MPCIPGMSIEPPLPEESMVFIPGLGAFFLLDLPMPFMPDMSMPAIDWPSISAMGAIRIAAGADGVAFECPAEEGAAWA